MFKTVKQANEQSKKFAHAFIFTREYIFFPLILTARHISVCSATSAMIFTRVEFFFLCTEHKNVKFVSRCACAAPVRVHSKFMCNECDDDGGDGGGGGEMSEKKRESVFVCVWRRTGVNFIDIAREYE